MIVQLPKLPSGPPPAGPDPLPQAQDQSLFADLIAVALREAGQPPLPDDLPPAAEMQAQAMVAGDLPSIVDPLPMVAGSDTNAPATAATRFNENGFFGHSLAQPEAAVPPYAASSGQGVATPGAAAAHSAFGGEEAPVGPGRPGLGRAGVATRPPAVVPTEPHAAATPAAGAPAAPDQTSEPSPEAEATMDSDTHPLAEKRLVRWLARQSQAGATTAAHVAMHEMESGMRVTASLGALEPRERERLRDQIAALLARHGLVARDIQIVGAPPAPRSPGRGD